MYLDTNWIFQNSMRGVPLRRCCSTGKDIFFVFIYKGNRFTKDLKRKNLRVSFYPPGLFAVKLKLSGNFDSG